MIYMTTIITTIASCLWALLPSLPLALPPSFPPSRYRATSLTTPYWYEDTVPAVFLINSLPAGNPPPHPTPPPSRRTRTGALLARAQEWAAM